MLGAMAADSMARRRRKIVETSSLTPPVPAPITATAAPVSSDIPHSNTLPQTITTTATPEAAATNHQYRLTSEEDGIMPSAIPTPFPSSRRDRHDTTTTPSSLSFPFLSRVHGRIGLDISTTRPKDPSHQGLPSTISPFSGSSSYRGSGASSCLLPPSCPLCTEPIKGGMSMVDHMELCPQNTRSCPACKGAVQVAAIDDHYLKCPRNTWPCFLCNKPVQMSGYVSHCSSCEAGSGATAQGCPTRMYHGTTHEAAAAILRTRRFELSDKGLLGVGVYVSRDVRKAMRYGPCVVECAVFQGRTVVIRERHHPLQKCWHKAKGYDSAWIPPDSFVLTQRATLEDDDPSVAVGTRGQTGGDLEEHCVADPRRVYPLHIVKFVH